MDVKCLLDLNVFTVLFKSISTISICFLLVFKLLLLPLISISFPNNLHINTFMLAFLCIFVLLYSFSKLDNH